MPNDSVPKQSSNPSAGSSPASAIAALAVKDPRTIYYDWMPVALLKPEAFRTVIAWNSASELPHVAYFDDGEERWFSQYDGVVIDDVTDWMHYLSPNGADSGSRGQLVTEATGSARAADLAPDEQRLVDYFRAMDDRARQMQSRLARRAAEDWPRDFITVPAELEEARQADTLTVAQSLSSAHDESPMASVNAPNLDDALDSIADDSDDIDCSLALLSDLLRVALNECERVGDAASYVETVIRAARRFGEDISESNMHLQRFVAVLEGKA